MKRFLTMALLGLATPVATLIAVAPGVAIAGQVQTTTFYIANMTCGLCPVTVNHALSAVKGVEKVEIDAVAKTAMVTFEPAQTTQAAIAAASADAGYPAEVKG